MARRPATTIEDAPFPPETWEHIAMYPDDDVTAGYRDWRPDDPPPGPNRSPGYRWGWANARRDRTKEDDGFGAVRHAYINATMARH
jgi:hypothetical protein